MSKLVFFTILTLKNRFPVPVWVHIKVQVRGTLDLTVTGRTDVTVRMGGTERIQVPPAQ